MLNSGDLGMLLKGVGFQPLDANGQPVRPLLDADGAPLAGSLIYDPATGHVSISVASSDGGTLQYVYSDVFDAAGMRNVSGRFNNLHEGQYLWGESGTLFLRNLDAGYGSYLGQYVPAAGEGDSAAHPFASALDTATHGFGASAVLAHPDYAVTQDAESGAAIVRTVVDYTPRMISQTIVSQAALNSTGVANGIDDFGQTPIVGNLPTNPGDPSYTLLFVLFGQFLDHGLDLAVKGGSLDPDTGASAKVIIPLAESDPLYAMAPGHSFVVTRGTVERFDADGAPRYANLTSTFSDQNQTYGSVPQVTDLLREWVEDPNNPGTFIPGMRLLDGYTLAEPWTRWDGVETRQTLPTVTELRLAVHATLNPDLGRSDFTYTDLLNFRGTGQALMADFMPFADLVDTTSELNIFGDGPNILKGVDLSSLLVLMPANPGDPASPTLVLGVKPGADPELVNEAMLQAVGAHYVAGDTRVNENIGLTSMHHVFHEEHNYRVDNLIDTILSAHASGDFTSEQLHAWQISVAGPGGAPLTDSAGNYVDALGAISWDQSRIFQAAKMIVEMEDQHVVFEQYARLVTPDLPEYAGYDPDIDASISLEFSQAAFRFGHSQLRETIEAIDPDGGITGEVMRFALASVFLNPAQYAELGPAALALGMSHQLGSETDEFVTSALQQSLLGQPMDLPAINIARGRDLGLPTLNEAREQLFALAQDGDYPLSGDLTPYESWNDFAASLLHPASLVNFIAAYSFDGDLAAASAALSDEAFMAGRDQGFRKIDLWIGGLAERHVAGGILGATFNAIFVDQIERLMSGDRLFYLARLAAELPMGAGLGDELAVLQLSDIVARTTGAEHLSGNAFLHAGSYRDLGRAPNSGELVARGSAADAHKYGDVVASARIGVYSDGGVSNAGNGTIVSVGGTSYIRDARPNRAPGLDGITPEAGLDAHEVLVGTRFDDLIYGGGGFDTLYGGLGNDRLFGGAGADFIYGEGGNDTIFGGAGGDHLDGGAGNDVLDGGADDDVLDGGEGNDQLIGGPGDDRLYGGAGDDLLDGGVGDDLIRGGIGSDVIAGGAGDDDIDGGAGHDEARYSGRFTDYTISTAVDGSIVIVDNRQGSPDGSDRLVRVETARFADREYELIANSAPFLVGSQTIMPAAASAEAYILRVADLIRGFADADGDPLTVANLAASVGELTANADGGWTFTPPPHFAGTATLSYIVADGHGGSVPVALSFPVEAVNHDPELVAPDRTLFARQSQPLEFTMQTSDRDGDDVELAMSEPSHGTLIGGADGKFVYMADAGFLGDDTIEVSVSDGNGGAINQPLTITVMAPPASGWTLLSTDGFAGEIGGSGKLFGTAAFQDIAVLDGPGSIFLDASFNRGGDVIRLAGAAADWEIIRESSTAVFCDGDTFVQVPVGVAGIAVVFDDGARSLRFDMDGGSMKIGTQSFGTELVAITASPDGIAATGNSDAAASAQLLLAPGAFVAAGGNLDVFGTSGAEQVRATSGDLRFDGSFNKGGDTLIFDTAAGSFTAVQSGSAVRLESAQLDALIPVGTSTVILSFASNDERPLFYDSGTDAITIGSQQIGFSPVSLADFA